MQRDNLINARHMHQQNNIPPSYNQNQRPTQQFQNQNQINSQNRTNNQVNFNIEQQSPSNSFTTSNINEFQNDFFCDANDFDEINVLSGSDFNMNDKCYESYDANYESDNFYVSNNMNNYDVRNNNFYDDNWEYNDRYFREFKDENSPDYDYTNNNTYIYNEIFYLEQ